MAKLQDANAKPAFTMEAEKSRLAAEEAGREKLAAVGVDVMETLATYSKQQELEGAKFKIGTANAFLKQFLRVHKRESRGCKLLTRANLFVQLPLWESTIAAAGPGVKLTNTVTSPFFPHKQHFTHGEKQLLASLMIGKLKFFLSGGHIRCKSSF